ncbi:hypothetical protein [Streptosporangium longisporum]|uniref:DUF5666 domain-containing protein n=1 Tax=Streptosporangium longisporum TaxID=46187 RepID=A0ABN3Y2X7_9ACTN
MAPEPDRFSSAETLANEPSRRRLPRSLLLAATSALVVITGAGVATAAAFSPSPAPTPTAGAPTTAPTASPSGAPSDEVPGRHRGRGHLMGPGGPSIHGEFVVPDGAGAYVTVATQYGEVTAVDQDSITVRSEDGHTREYVVDGTTRVGRGGTGIDTIKTGQKVRVMAKVNGGTATAVMIRDTAVRDRFGMRGDRGERGERGERQHGHGHRPGGPPPVPATPPAPDTPSAPATPPANPSTPATPQAPATPAAPSAPSAPAS